MQFGFFCWALVERRYGADVEEWLNKVWLRMKDESDSQILWRYLYYRTVVATEPEACETLWFEEQKNWDEGDLAVWKDYARFTDRVTELDEAIAESADPNADIIMAGDPDPLLYECRRLFAAIRHVQAALSREATYHQNITARYIMLEEGAAKTHLYRLYASRISTRLDGLHMRIGRDVVTFLDNLSNLGTSKPNIKAWLCSDGDIDRMWNIDIADLKTKLQHILQHFQVVCNVFSEDRDRRRVGVDQLGAIPSGAAQNQAQRIRRLAMRQYNRLGADDPRKRCADEWLEILRSGDLLRNPAPGTPEWQFTQRLARRNASINAAVDAQREAVEGQHPDPQTPRHF